MAPSMNIDFSISHYMRVMSFDCSEQGVFLALISACLSIFVSLHHIQEMNLRIFVTHPLAYPPSPMFFLLSLYNRHTPNSIWFVRSGSREEKKQNRIAGIDTASFADVHLNAL
jgi:hypothetical protein